MGEKRRLVAGTPLGERLDFGCVPLRGDLIALSIEHRLAE